MGRHVVLLVGPKGVGKSSVGRLLARTYGYVHVEPEPLWIEHAARRSSLPDTQTWEREGFALVAAAVTRALDTNDVVVTDTTGAADGTGAFIEALGRLGTVHVLRLSASPAACRARIDRRDASRQLPADPALVARVHERSVAANLDGATAEVALDLDADVASPVFLLPTLRRALLAGGAPATARAPTLTTARTVLRSWRAADRAPLAAINADPAVAAHLVAPLTAAETDALLARITEGFETYSFGPWALEVPGVHALAGFCGLWVPAFEAHFTPAVEIAWRLTPSAWGHGYVTESARVVLAHAFDELELNEVVAFTSPRNARSLAVMERLGFVRDRDGDFEHPRVPEGHPLRPHVLYRATGVRDRCGRSELDRS